MKYLSGFVLLVVFNGILGIPRPTRYPSDDHFNEDDLRPPMDNDALPTPPSSSIDDDAPEPDSLNWDEEDIYRTEPKKLDDKPSCAHAQKVMAKINGYRRVHGAGPVLHDPTLSKAAATWANSIRNSGKAKFDPKSKYGQNICIAPKGEKDIPTTCVVDFYKTIEHYDWSTAKPTASSKFFAQMVYTGVKSCGVGCAVGPLGRTYVVVLFDKILPTSSVELQKGVQGYTDVFTSAPGAKCEKEHIQYDGSCYKFNTEAKNWEDALKTCAADISVLVNIHSNSEEQFLRQLKAPKGEKRTTEWLALDDIVKEGTYVAADGSSLTYLDWKIGEPHGNGQNCVEFDSKSQFGAYADIKCTEKRPFFCKKPLEGDILFSITLSIGTKYTSELQNSFSKLYQELVKKLKEDLKEALKGENSLKHIVVGSLSKVESKKKSKRATDKKTPPATTSAKVYLQFGPKDTPSDPATPISDYITKNKGKLPKLSETAKVDSVSIVLPGQEPPIVLQAIAAAKAAKAACGVPSCYGTCAPSCPASCCSSAFGSAYGYPGSSSPIPQPSPYGAPQTSPYGSQYGAAPCAQPPCSPTGLSSYPQPQQPQIPKHITMLKQQKTAPATAACGQYGQAPCSPYGQAPSPYSTPYVQQPSIAAAPCVRSATGQCLPSKPLTIRVPLLKSPKVRSVCPGAGCQSPLPLQIAPAQPIPPMQPFGTPYGAPYGAALPPSPYAQPYGSPCSPPMACNTKKKGKKPKKSKAVASTYGGSPPFLGSNPYGQSPYFAPSPCGAPPLNPCAPPPIPAPAPFGNPCLPTPMNPCIGKRAVLPQKPQLSPFGLSPFGANPLATSRCAVPPCPPLMPPMLPPMPPRLPMQQPCAAPPCPPPMPPMLPPMPPRLPMQQPCAAPPCPPPMPPMLPPMPPRLPMQQPCAAPPCPPPMPPMLPSMPPRLPMQPPCAAPPCPPPMPPMMPPVGVAIGMLPQTPFTPNPFNPCIPSFSNPCTPKSPVAKKGKGKSKSAKKAPSAPPAPQFQSIYGYTSPPMVVLPPPQPFPNPCAPTPFNANPCANKPAVKKGKNAKPKSKSKAPPRPPSPFGVNPYAQASPFGSPFNPCGPPPMANPCIPPMLPPMPPPLPPPPMPPMALPMLPPPPPVPAYGLYSPPSPFGANPCNPAFSPCPPPNPKKTSKKAKKVKKPAAPKGPQPQIIPPQYPGAPLTIQMPPIVTPVTMPVNQVPPFGLPPMPNPNQCNIGCLARATCPSFCSAACCKRGRMIRAKKSQIFRRFKI